MRQRNYNIKIKSYRLHNRTSAERELYGFAVLIQAHYGSSMMKEVDTRKVQSFLHCGRQKACNLLKRAKESDLFAWDEEKRILTVKSQRNKYAKVNKNNKTYISDMVISVERSRLCSMTLRDIVRFLEDNSILYIVNANDPDSSKSPDNNDSKRCAEPKGLPLSRVAKFTGMSVPTIHARLKEMVGKGILTKRNAFVRVFNNTAENVKTFRKSVLYKAVVPLMHAALAVVPCAYRVQSLDVKVSFQHRIWNFKAVNKFEECVHNVLFEGEHPHLQCFNH